MRPRVLVVSGALLSLFVLTVLLHAGEKNKHSARWGDLHITATGVECPESVEGWAGRPHPPREDYYYFRVHLAVRNVGKRAVSASFAPRLSATYGLEYRPTLFTRDKDEPEVHELLPGEEVRGSYTFEVKKGAQPLELLLGERRPRIRLQGLLPKPLDSQQEE